MTFKLFLRHAGASYLRQLIDDHSENIAEAARIAGLNRTYLYRLSSKYGVVIPKKERSTNRGNSAWRQLGGESRRSAK